MKKIFAVLLALILAVAMVGSVSAGTDWEWDYDVEINGVQGPSDDCEGTPDQVYCEFTNDWGFAQYQVFDSGDPANYGVDVYGFVQPGATVTLELAYWGSGGLSDQVEVDWSYPALKKYIPYSGRGGWVRLMIRKIEGDNTFHLDAVRIWDSVPPIEAYVSPGNQRDMSCHNQPYLNVTRINATTLSFYCGEDQGSGFETIVPSVYSPPVTDLYQTDSAKLYCTGSGLTYQRLSDILIRGSCD